ncbi:MAG TPA: NAD-dependent protein deacylase [Clostridia bacterium]
MSEDKLKEILNSNNIVFFGGAGVSTESDIPDFRSANGLYSETTKSTYTPEEILSHTFFMSHTKEFFDFYKSKMIYANAKPNKAHLALAKLEEAGKLKAVVTQNIDGLHQAAGSKNVFELHGSIHRNYCMNCRKSFDLSYILSSECIPKCDACQGIVKPDVVLYEEMLDNCVIAKSIQYIKYADVLIVGGTSLSVYPASGLVTYYRGNKLVLINKSATSFDSKADLVISGSIGEVLGSVGK